MNSREFKLSLQNPATSYWLQNLIKTADWRDPVDALHDVSILKEYLEKKLDELL